MLGKCCLLKTASTQLLQCSTCTMNSLLILISIHVPCTSISNSPKYIGHKINLNLLTCHQNNVKKSCLLYVYFFFSFLFFFFFFFLHSKQVLGIQFTNSNCQQCQFCSDLPSNVCHKYWSIMIARCKSNKNLF